MMAGWVAKDMGGSSDGRTDEWMEGWMEGWINLQENCKNGNH